MSIPSAEVAADFKDALQDLKINSRPEISNLTIIAKENTEHAQAISRELENHIRTARPEWKLPALYVLDSIVKNVGTPYTVYLGRDLYRTFMDAYTIMDPGTRKAMEGLVKTWKQPVPESMDNRPVFPHDVTRDIENALIKFRTVAVQQQALSQRQGIQHSLPARPMTMPNGPWRNTPTPPQPGARFPTPNDPRLRQPYPATPQFGQYPALGTPPTQFQSPQPHQQPVSSTDLDNLKTDLAKLIAATRTTFASNPTDPVIQTKLKALLDLETVLKTQTLPPHQLETIRNQIQALTPLSAPLSAFTPSVQPPMIQSPQQTPAPAIPTINTPLNIAQLFANIGAPMPPMPAPTVTTPSLADMLARVSTPMQRSSTPTALPAFYPPQLSAGLPSAVAASQPPPAAAPMGSNLAQLLANLTNPANTPATPHPPTAQTLQIPQLPPQPPSVPPVPDWLQNALKGLSGNGISAQPTPLVSEPMTRQTSANVNAQTNVELTTASLKKPRLHLISRLYEARPNLCVTCGRRFENSIEGKQKKARHMDWHFKVKDPEAAKRGIHRSWFIGEKEWIEYREVDETAPPQAPNGARKEGAAAKKEAKDKYVLAPTNATNHPPCPICQEEFKHTWSAEANDFIFMDAIKVHGKIYHASCWEDYSGNAGIPMPTTPDSVLGKRKAEVSSSASGKKQRAY